MTDFADRYVLGEGIPIGLANRWEEIGVGLDRFSVTLPPEFLDMETCPRYRLVLERVDASLCENCGVVLNPFWGRCPKCGGFYRTGVRDEQEAKND